MISPASRIFMTLVVLCSLITGGLAQTAERIVVADGALTEILYALGAEDHIVGVDTTSIHPPEAEALPNVGYLRALSAEGVLSLNPDLLLTTQDAGPETVLNQIREAGIPVHLLQVDYSLSGTRALIEEVGDLVDLAPEAAQLSEQLAADVNSHAGQMPDDLRILFLLQATGQGFMASGRDTRAHALLTLTGATNPMAHLSGYRPLTNEAAMEANPDVILVSHTEGDVARLYDHPALRLTNAAQDGRIFAIDQTYWLTFGPRLGESVAELTELLQSQQTSLADQDRP